ncbi:MAG: PaaI family thioesterase [Actinomycetota bacterium]|nr:PaaI family thioesterase [Actinomycetota bacterium]
MTDGRVDRAALADEVRSLVADVNRLTLTGDAVAAARSMVAAARQALDGPERRRWYEVPLVEIDAELEARLRAEAFDHSLFRGQANPLAPPLVVTTEVDEDGRYVVGSVRLDRSREGPPERLHGGYLAGLFDDVLSGVPSLVEMGPTVTARLAIRFREPTPLDVDLRFEARVVRHSGRRLVARARCLVCAVDAGVVADGSTVTAEAEALFVAVPARAQETGSGEDR